MKTKMRVNYDLIIRSFMVMNSTNLLDVSLEIVRGAAASVASLRTTYRASIHAQALPYDTLSAGYYYYFALDPPRLRFRTHSVCLAGFAFDTRAVRRGTMHTCARRQNSPMYWSQKYP